jgi:hypothetical protein
LNGWASSIGVIGGLLIGVAVACTVVRHLGLRVAVAVPIGFFTSILSRAGSDILAVVWAIAVAGWWGWHAWTLAYTARRGPHRVPAPDVTSVAPRPDHAETTEFTRIPGR